MTMNAYFPESHAPERKPQWWARLTGKRHWDSSHRYSWGEFNPSFRGLSFEFGCYSSPHLKIAFIIGQAFITLPRWAMRFFGGENHMERNAYGFSWRWFDADGLGDIHLSWKQWSKTVSMPWGWGLFEGEYLGTDGEFYPNEVDPEYFGRTLGISRKPLPPVGPPCWKAVYPYHYMTQEGEAQHVNATVKRGRSTRTWRLFGIPLRRKIDHDIKVDFDAEVGNQRGSWKGGVLGCGYSMKPGETPFQALRRMQRERNFDR